MEKTPDCNHKTGEPDSTKRRKKLIRREITFRGKDYVIHDIVRAIKEQGIWPTLTPQEVDAIVSMYTDCIVINEIVDCAKALGIEDKKDVPFSVESYARNLVELTFGWEVPPKRDEAKDDDDQNV